MTYTNLPPTLFEMFGSLDDRVRKLETGPSLPYATAVDALQQAQTAQFAAVQSYSVATQAQLQAINAGIQANLAQSQATVAQSTASFAQSLAYAAQATANSASAQATVAQNTANGKNKVYYSLVTPGTTANTAGDIWFQYSGSGLVIGQYVGLGGTSWQQQTITQAVIGNLDAGKVTTGILNAIEITAGSGSQVFRVTPTGYLSAQGAYIKGNITADSGTFNGTVNASAGYFGNFAGGQYWSIGASGITGVGTATITGGLIQGSSIQVPQVSPLFSVNAFGQMTATAGQIAGWTINSTNLTVTSGTKTTTLDASTATLSLSDSSTNYLNSGAVTISASGATTYYQASGVNITNKLAVDTMDELGNVAANPRIYAPANVAIRIVPNAAFNSQTYPVSVEGALSVVGTMYNAGIASGTGTGLVVVGTSFRIASTTSSERFKTDITEIDSTNILDKIDQMRPINFRIAEEYAVAGEDNPLTAGFLAEDIADIEGFDTVVNRDPLGDPFSISYDRLTTFLAMGIKELNKRVKALEGNNG